MNDIRMYINLALILGFVIALIVNIDFLAVVFFCLYFIADLTIEMIQLHLENKEEEKRLMNAGKEER